MRKKKNEAGDRKRERKSDSRKREREREDERRAGEKTYERTFIPRDNGQFCYGTSNFEPIDTGT